MSLRAKAVTGALALALASPGLIGCAAGMASPAPVSRAASQPTPNYSPLGTAGLNAVLLAQPDLPSGYTVDPRNSNTATMCGYKPKYQHVVVGRTFIKGRGLNSVLATVRIYEYPSAAQAKVVFRQVQDIAVKCREHVTSNGARSRVSMIAVPGGMRGPALGLEVDGLDTNPLAAALSYVLVGPAIVQAGSGGLGTADTKLVFDLLREQAERYAEAAQP